MVDWIGIGVEVAAALSELSETEAVIVTKTVSGGSVFDPETETPSEQTVNAVPFDVEQQHIDGTDVQRGDQRVIISAPIGMAKPTKADKFRWKTTPTPQDLNIIHVESLQPGGPDAATVYHTLWVRK